MKRIFFFILTLISLSFTPVFATTCTLTLDELLQRPVIADTWGIEMELTIPPDLNQEKVAEIMEEFLISQGKREVFITNKTVYKTPIHYYVNYIENGKLRTWGVPYEPDFDNNLTTDYLYYPGVEITTPVMSGEADKKLFRKMVRHLKDHGLYPARQIGGTHVHWGTQGLTFTHLERIYSGYIEVYPLLKKIFRPDETRDYIDMASLKETYEKIKNVPNPGKLVEDFPKGMNIFKRGPIRYNTKYNTLETRFFNSSVNAGRMLKQAEFSRVLIEKILTDDVFYRSLRTMNERELLEALGMEK